MDQNELSRLLRQPAFLMYISLIKIFTFAIYYGKILFKKAV